VSRDRSYQSLRESLGIAASSVPSPSLSIN
jgi:hypothetical protein